MKDVFLDWLASYCHVLASFLNNEIMLLGLAFL